MDFPGDISPELLKAFNDIEHMFSQADGVNFQLQGGVTGECLLTWDDITTGMQYALAVVPGQGWALSADAVGMKDQGSDYPFDPSEVANAKAKIDVQWYEEYGEERYVVSKHSDSMPPEGPILSNRFLVSGGLDDRYGSKLDDMYDNLHERGQENTAKIEGIRALRDIHDRLITGGSGLGDFEWEEVMSAFSNAVYKLQNAGVDIRELDAVSEYGGVDSGEFKRGLGEFLQKQGKLAEDNAPGGVSPPPEEVVEFLRANPNPTDDELHAWAEENRYDTSEVEAIMYQLATEGLGVAGRGNSAPFKFAKEEEAVEPLHRFYQERNIPGDPQRLAGEQGALKVWEGLRELGGLMRIEDIQVERITAERYAGSDGHIDRGELRYKVHAIVGPPPPKPATLTFVLRIRDGEIDAPIHFVDASKKKRLLSETALRDYLNIWEEGPRQSSRIPKAERAFTDRTLLPTPPARSLFRDKLRSDSGYYDPTM